METMNSTHAKNSPRVQHGIMGAGVRQVRLRTSGASVEKLPDGKDFVANILLFVPFGFAVAWISERRFRWLAALLIACLGSFVFSFGIEFTQAYMPTRTSSWYDVAANTMGGPIGWFAFRVLGTRVEKILLALLIGFYKALHPSVLALFFIAYWAAGTFISVPLNRMSILRNWDDSVPLFVGNIPGQSVPR